MNSETGTLQREETLEVAVNIGRRTSDDDLSLMALRG
jgi:hypothetical protein